MRVRLVDLERLHAPIRAELDRAIARVVDGSRFILGPEVEAFERELAEACGVRFAVGVSSGTDALLASLHALGVGRGDEVVTPAFSFCAAAEAIARVGATPVFADVDDELLLDPSALRLGPRTRAVVPVDLFGRRAPVPEGALRCTIEDAAQAIGAPGIGRGVRAATLSFFPTKNLGALGDGGAVLTDDESFADAVRLLRSHGARTKYVHDVIGGNLRLDALQAAVLRVKLPHVARWNEARRRIASVYRERLGDVEGLTLPSAAPDHAWHQFVVRATDRDALRAHLAERGVETEIYYPLALHLQPCFAKLGGAPGDHPRAEEATRRALALPIHATLEAREIDHVTRSVREFFSA